MKNSDLMIQQNISVGVFPYIRTRRMFLRAVIIVICAATCNALADLFLQYNPQGAYETNALLAIAPWRVLTGHFLGIAALPLEIIGYWLVCSLMLTQAPRLFRFLFWGMAYAVIIGTVFHGTFMAQIFTQQAAASAPAASQAAFQSTESLLTLAILPLASFFLICYLAFWTLFTIFAWRKSSVFPRWIVVLNPALLSLLITLLYRTHVFPPLMNLLYPMVLSLPHLVFFLMILLTFHTIFSNATPQSTLPLSK